MVIRMVKSFEEQFCAAKLRPPHIVQPGDPKTAYLCRPLKAGRRTEYLAERAVSAALIGFFSGSVSGPWLIEHTIQSSSHARRS